ncbi:MAG: tRNA (adenosine(37)-N6)-threonylcarbamoyltransferase complex ATPase subunit type 1 TsaE [Bacteriovoracales bacterium]|nr:tRNA (adenosine(37)-N6)-threonylcarbamoyltransferase complex ATPase subunit type 1 TsaE [Bacteriovoracales bacterium]
MKESLSIWKKVYLQDLDYVAREMREMMKTPCLALLEGTLGAGKTTLLQSFFPTIAVLSPSYSLLNEMGEIVHGDFYRIENEEELTHLEIPLYLDKKDYFFVEWGKKFFPLLKKYVDSDWFIYQIDVGINGDSKIKGTSRNYTLFHLTDS